MNIIQLINKVTIMRKMINVTTSRRVEIPVLNKAGVLKSYVKKPDYKMSSAAR